jgi:hypothetical protein
VTPPLQRHFDSHTRLSQRGLTSSMPSWAVLGAGPNASGCSRRWCSMMIATAASPLIMPAATRHPRSDTQSGTGSPPDSPMIASATAVTSDGSIRCQPTVSDELASHATISASESGSSNEVCYLQRRKLTESGRMVARRYRDGRFICGRISRTQRCARVIAARGRAFRWLGPHCHARAITVGSARSRTASANRARSSAVTLGRSVVASECAARSSVTLSA